MIPIEKLVIYLEALVGTLGAAAATLALAWLRRLNTTAGRANRRSENNRAAIRRILEHIGQCEILDEILEDNPEAK